MEKWKTDELSFADSWKGKEVELAATSALIVGVGALAATGHAPQVVRYGTEALKRSGQAAENYLKRRVHPVVRYGYDTTKQTIRKFKDIPDVDQKVIYDEKLNKQRAIREAVSDDTIRTKTRERMNNHFADYELEIARKKELDPNFVAPSYEKPSVIEMEERVRQELFEKNWNHGRPLPEDVPQKKRVPKNDYQRKQMVDNVIGSAVAGTAFGGGITLFHGLNDKYTKDQKQKREAEKTFTAAGSFYKKGEEEMDKQAGIREVHQGLGDWLKKIPNAAATGLGFTGVSLGTAAILNKKREEERKLKEQERDRNRIIIEFGEDDVAERGAGDHIQAGGISMIPRPNFDKIASNRFLKNLGGRGAERNALKEHIDTADYKALAAEQLKGQNIDELVGNQYGHLFEGEKARDMFLDSKAKEMKNLDLLKQKEIETEVAKVQLPTFGGLGLAGIGAGVYALNKKEDPNEQRRYGQV